jgi:hypothetical protein
MRQSSTDQWREEMIKFGADRNESRQSNNDQVDSKQFSVDMAKRIQSISIITDQMDMMQSCRHGGGDTAQY